MYCPMRKYRLFNRIVLCLTISFCLIAYSCSGQESFIRISGTVIDSASHTSLDHASVYLSNTTLGTYTLKDGTFSLSHIPPGRYDMVVSYLGYRRKVIPIDEKSNNKTFRINLSLHTTRLKRVIVRAGIQRKEYLQMFERYFIGIGNNAPDCKILNTDALFFEADKDSGIFTAETDEPLIIRNMALGYLIYYDLKSFRYDRKQNRVTYFGYPKFEALHTRSKRRQNEWRKNRIKAYLGSMRHFMKSLIARRLKENGFEVNKVTVIFDPYLHKKNNVLSTATVPYDSMITVDENKPGYDKLKFTNSLYITPFHYKTPHLYHYFDWKNDSPLSQMTVTEHPSSIESYTHRLFMPSILTMAVPETFIDRNGVITDPLAVTKQGGWADRQVADLLPFDYVMPDYP